MTEFVAIHPVVDVRDIDRSVAWFRDVLGFELQFVDDSSDAGYASVGRDSIQLHLQWHSEEEWAHMSGSAYRLVVVDPDELFAEIAARGEMPEGKQVLDTAWGTREFGLYDRDNNAFFLYRDA